MSVYLFKYSAVEPTTWVYLSSLLMIGLFFKFNRLWSIRNLDLLGLIQLAPGLILVEYGRTHGTVHEPQHFDYLQTPYDAHLSFQELNTRTGFVGHSHIPVTFFDGMPITYSVDTHIELPGGQPFDAERAIGRNGSRRPDTRSRQTLYSALARQPQ